MPCCEALIFVNISYDLRALVPYFISILIVARTCFSSNAKQTLANYKSIQSENVYSYLDILWINYCQNQSINWDKNTYSTIMTNSVCIHHVVIFAYTCIGLLFKKKMTKDIIGIKSKTICSNVDFIWKQKRTDTWVPARCSLTSVCYLLDLLIIY